MKIHPEHESTDAFLALALDNDCYTFLPGDAQQIARATGRPVAAVTAELRRLGLSLRLNDSRTVRGFTSNPHGSNRYAGNAGGGGGDCLTGFAGREG